MKQRVFFLLLGISLLTFSCKEDQLQLDRDIIEEYIAEHDLDAESTPSGLYYVIEKPGNDQRPDLSHDVEVKYRGYLTSGQVFDETTGNNTLTAPLSNLILGWQEGIPLFGKSGKGILLIPSHLGYGDRQVGVIPENSVLIFDIELIDFE